jgi:hypothetical protein
MAHEASKARGECRARVIEGEASASRGEQLTESPMICDREFSGEILLVFFFSHSIVWGSYGGVHDFGGRML